MNAARSQISFSVPPSSLRCGHRQAHSFAVANGYPWSAPDQILGHIVLLKQSGLVKPSESLV